MSKINRFFLYAAALSVLTLPVTVFQNCSKAGKSSLSSQSIQPNQNFTSPSPPSPPPPPVHPEAGTYKPILADRYYLDAQFTNIFGPQARAVNSVPIETDAVNFGSLCSMYENYNTYNATTGKYSVAANPMESCNIASTNLRVAQTLTNETVGRQALINRACADLTQNTATATHALAKISTAGIPAPTADNIKAAIRLFYRTQPMPDAAVIQSLQVMFPTDTASLDDWKGVLYTVCISSYWQVL